MKFVSGLILAAGASSRMGQPKQILPFHGTTLLEYVTGKIEDCSSLDEVVVVLGANADEVREKVKFRRAKVVVNAAATGEGCSASYRTGISAFDPRTEAMVVLPGDQPGVDTNIVDAIVSEWQRGGGSIVLASYQGGRKGHPMLFSRELFDQLCVLHGDKAVWKIVDAHPDWVREVRFDRPYPTDINTLEDYERAERRLKADGH